MSLQNEIIDINGNKITDNSKCIEHHCDGDTYKSKLPVTQSIVHKELLYYTLLQAPGSLIRSREYTNFEYRIKKR